MKQSTKSIIRDYCLIILGSLLVAVAVHFFMAPSNIVLGSVTGLAVILINFIPVSLSVMTLILNICFLIIGFLFFGKEFGLKTVCSAILQPVFLFVFEQLFPNFSSLTNDMVLDTLCCVIIIGIGIVMLFNANASSGGLDVLAKVLNKYVHLDVGKGVALLGIITVLCSIFVYDSKTVVIGILGTYFSGLVIDAYISNSSQKKQVCILTDKEDELTDYINRVLNRGATLYDAQGAYGRKERHAVVSILTNSEYGQLMEHIHKVHPEAFVSVSTINEVVGDWNTSERLKEK